MISCLSYTRLFQTDVKLTNSQEYQVEYTIQQINNGVNVFLLLQFKDVPKFFLFGPESKTGEFDQHSFEINNIDSRWTSMLSLLLALTH